GAPACPVPASKIPHAAPDKRLSIWLLHHCAQDLSFRQMMVKPPLDAALPRACDQRAGRVRGKFRSSHAQGPLMPITRVAVAGLGAIGRVVARRLSAGMGDLTLAWAAARDHAKARAWLDAERITCPLVEPEAFPAHADLAVECTPAGVLERICRPMLEAGKQVMVLSVGALLPRPDLIELAKARGGQIIVPTGALLGLDAVTPAAEGRIHSTRTPPRALGGALFLDATGTPSGGFKGPKLVFPGGGGGGAGGFPANVNVAAALALAGIGPDRTMMEIWAAPSVDRNCHTVEVDSDSARFTLAIENVPSENPRTGRITALSVVAALR